MSGRSAILIAEDDVNDAFFLERALAQIGVNGPARFVKTGREALDYLQGNPPFDHRGENPLPNLLVLDLKMPLINGFEVLDWIRRDSSFHRMPVIVLSGSEAPADIDRAYSLGADVYLTKPHRTAQLCEIMKPVLQKYAAATLQADSGSAAAPSNQR